MNRETCETCIFAVLPEDIGVSELAVGLPDNRVRCSARVVANREAPYLTDNVVMGGGYPDSVRFRDDECVFPVSMYGRSRRTLDDDYWLHNTE